MTKRKRIKIKCWQEEGRWIARWYTSLNPEQIGFTVRGDSLPEALAALGYALEDLI